MARKRFTSEQIITMLREAEVMVNQGSTVIEVARKLSISEQTYYRWRKEYNRYRPHSSLGYQPPAPDTYEAKNLIMQEVQ
jgi:transposase-like protein